MAVAMGGASGGSGGGGGGGRDRGRPALFHRQAYCGQSNTFPHSLGSL